MVINSKDIGHNPNGKLMLNMFKQDELVDINDIKTNKFTITKKRKVINETQVLKYLQS